MRTHRRLTNDPYAETAALLAGVDLALREGDPERAAALARQASAMAAELPVPSARDPQGLRHLHTLRASARRIDITLDRLSHLNGESLAGLVAAATPTPYAAGPRAAKRAPAGLQRWEA